MRRGALIAACFVAGCSAFGTDSSTTSASDDAGAGDAGSDAVVTVGQVPCSGTLSDDFSSPPTLPKWSLTAPGGAVVLDPTVSVSAPSSLKIDVSLAGGEAAIASTFPRAKRLCLELALETNGDSVSAFKLTEKTDVYRLHFSFGSGSFFIGESSSSAGFDRELGSLRYTTAWTKLHVEVAFPVGAGKGTLLVRQDGKDAVTATLGEAGEDFGVDTLTLGARANPGVTGRVVHYDDVSLGAQ